MVVGDVVSVIGTAGATLTFQPAAGVEVAIKTTWVSTGGSRAGALFDGVNVTVPLFNRNDAATSAEQGLVQTMFITNALYFHVFGTAGVIHGLSGIQIR